MSDNAGVSLAKFCASPWIESVLRIDGKHCTCCKNPTSLGNWLTTELSQSWNSDKYVEFREKVVAGIYPDEFCRLCHGNGTAPSLRQLLQRSIHEYNRMLKALGAVGVFEIAKLLTVLDKKVRDSEFVAVIDVAKKRLMMMRNHIERNVLASHAILPILKIEKIIKIMEDFVDGNVRPTNVAPFRQGNLVAVCNARCIHCPGLFSGEIVDGHLMKDGTRFKEMMPDSVERVFQHEDDIIDFFMNGSEFLFSKSWESIAQRLKAQGIRVRFSTNGMLLNKRNTDLLIKNRYLGKLNVSLDGGTPEVIELVRERVKYDRVMENLTYLMGLARAEDYVFTFSMSFALMTDNYKTLPQFVDLAAKIRDINPSVGPSIMVQPLSRKGVPAYGDFFQIHHPSNINHDELKAQFEAMHERAEALNLPVYVFFTYTLKDFVAKGCPIPSSSFIRVQPTTSQLDDEFE